MNKDMYSGGVIKYAYIESLNKLRELLSLGKGSLISIGCLESSINGGMLNDESRDFYSKSLLPNDFVALKNDRTIVIPLKDKNRYNFMRNIKFI